MRRRSHRKDHAMRRVSIAVSALVLAALIVGVVPIPGGAQDATPAAPPATTPQPPTQPTNGPGSSEARFRGVTTIEEIPPDQFQPDYWLYVPADPLPGTTGAGEPLPLVIFVHAYSIQLPNLYLAWIEH